MKDSRQPTILIIEDDADTLAAVDDALTHFGYRTMTAQRALEALDIARRHHPDLIFTDINLPDMTGLELAANLRHDESFAKTPIIAGSIETENVREQAVAAGINGFLSKPYSLESLGLEIQFFLSGGVETIDENERLHEARNTFIRTTVTRLEGRIRELEMRNEDLLRLDHMKDTFIQLTAHELRTPLTLITGYTRLLEDHDIITKISHGDEGLRTLVEGLSDSVTRMHRVIEEILTMSRIMTHEIDTNIRSIDPAKCVRDVLEDYRAPLVERRLTFYYNEAEWPQMLHADEDMFCLIIDNLVSNAIKYTPDKGKLALIAEYSDEFLRITMRDSGIGIDTSNMDAIFKRMTYSGDVSLHTTSKTAFMGGGLGLGLSIVKGIVESHNGTITVESDGRDIERCPGSEFVIILPLRQPELMDSISKNHPPQARNSEY